MNKKLSVRLSLIMISFFMFLNFNRVEAYSGELDPKGYIFLPSTIYMNNEIATSTISTASSVNDYEMSYQKIDITENTFNKIQAKNKELTDYIEENNKILKEKEANIQTLKTEYETLMNSENAATEQLTQAKNKFDEAYKEYKTFYETISTQIEVLKNECKALIPDYTNSWTKTTRTSNNMKLDFTGYSGDVYFVLWAKIEKGTDEYYNANVYSSNIPEEEKVTINKSSSNVNIGETVQLTATSSTNSKITWTSSDNSVATVNSNGLVKGIKEGTAVITAKGEKKTAICTITVEKVSENTDDKKDEAANTEIKWTDFSKAKFELKKDGDSGAIIEISNVVPKENREYYLFITNNSKKPEVKSDMNDTSIYLIYDKNDKKFKTTVNSRIAKYVELNQNLYGTIVEKVSYNNEKIVTYGNKLERYAEPRYNEAFTSTFIAYDANQLVTTFSHSSENNRKIQIKIGKITDNTILQKIKNKDSLGFNSLLSFAKSNNGIYNKIVDADKESINIEYTAGKNYSSQNELINLKGLEDEAYYFLYIKADDENGKYIPQEAVTLAQANVFDKEWFLFFYGTSDFKWAEFGDTKKDDTTAQGKLPQTGVNTAICVTLGLILIAGGTISYILYRKNNY